MEGTTRWGLAEAVKAVHQNALGHPFFPAPSEIRMLHDRAMEPHVRMRERIAREERIRRETPPAIPPRTAEQKVRAMAIMERFHASMPKSDPKEEFDWSRVHERFDPKPDQLSQHVEQEDAA